MVVKWPNLEAITGKSQNFQNLDLQLNSIHFSERKAPLTLIFPSKYKRVTHSVLRVILTPQISKMIETPIFGPG